jgi:DNA-binding FrmR family transcriptional regulator
MAAVGKAINNAAFTLISASLKECLEEDKSNSAAVTAKLQKLFLSFHIQINIL